MSGRDPRRDPRAVDVLRLSAKAAGNWQRGQRRTVTYVHDDGTVRYDRGRCSNEVEADAWRRWAAGAEVLRVAEEVQGE